MGAPTWQNVFEIENLFHEGNLLSLASLAIQSQYSASPRMNALMTAFQNELDASAQIDLFYDKVFNVKTCGSKSLDVWGRIVGVTRTLQTEDVSVTWEDDTYRFLILYKALENISAADAATMNTLLPKLFGDDVLILDGGDMTIRAVFLFFPTDVQIAVLEAYGLLTRGAGVGWEFYRIKPEETFGFDGSEMQPFNQAPFDPYGLKVNY